MVRWIPQQQQLLSRKLKKSTDGDATMCTKSVKSTPDALAPQSPKQSLFGRFRNQTVRSDFSVDSKVSRECMNVVPSDDRDFSAATRQDESLSESRISGTSERREPPPYDSKKPQEIRMKLPFFRSKTNSSSYPKSLSPKSTQASWVTLTSSPSTLSPPQSPLYLNCKDVNLLVSPNIVLPRSQRDLANVIGQRNNGEALRYDVVADNMRVYFCRNSFGEGMEMEYMEVNSCKNVRDQSEELQSMVSSARSFENSEPASMAITDKAQSDDKSKRRVNTIRILPTVLQGVLVKRIKSIEKGEVVCYVKVLETDAEQTKFSSHISLSLPITSTIDEGKPMIENDGIIWSQDDDPMKDAPNTLFVAPEVIGPRKGELFDSIALEIGLKSDAHVVPIGTALLDINDLTSNVKRKVLKLQRMEKKKTFFSKNKKSETFRIGNIICEINNNVSLQVLCNVNGTVSEPDGVEVSHIVSIVSAILSEEQNDIQLQDDHHHAVRSIETYSTPRQMDLRSAQLLPTQSKLHETDTNNLSLIDSRSGMVTGLVPSREFFELSTGNLTNNDKDVDSLLQTSKDTRSSQTQEVSTIFSIIPFLREMIANGPSVVTVSEVKEVNHNAIETVSQPNSLELVETIDKHLPNVEGDINKSTVCKPLVSEAAKEPTSTDLNQTETKPGISKMDESRLNVEEPIIDEWESEVEVSEVEATVEALEVKVSDVDQAEVDHTEVDYAEVDEWEVDEWESEEESQVADLAVVKSKIEQSHMEENIAEEGLNEEEKFIKEGFMATNAIDLIVRDAKIQDLKSESKLDVSKLDLGKELIHQVKIELVKISDYADTTETLVNQAQCADGEKGLADNSFSDGFKLKLPFRSGQNSSVVVKETNIPSKASLQLVKLSKENSDVRLVREMVMGPDSVPFSDSLLHAETIQVHENENSVDVGNPSLEAHSTSVDSKNTELHASITEEPLDQSEKSSSDLDGEEPVSSLKDGQQSIDKLECDSFSVQFENVRNSRGENKEEKIPVRTTITQTEMHNVDILSQNALARNVAPELNHDRVQKLITYLDSDSTCISTKASAASIKVENDFICECIPYRYGLYSQPSIGSSVSSVSLPADASTSEDADEEDNFSDESTMDDDRDPNESSDVQDDDDSVNTKVATQQLMAIAAKLNMNPSDLFDLIEAEDNVDNIVGKLRQ